MRHSKRRFVVEAVEQLSPGEFTTEDVRARCRRDLTTSEISGNLRSIEGVRYVRKGSSITHPPIWEKL